MESRAQGFGPHRIISSAVEVPDLRLTQWAKRTLLRIEVNDILVIPVDHAHRPVPKRLEDAIFRQILGEGQPLTFTLAVAVQPRYQGLAAHPIRSRLTSEFENCGRQCRLIRSKSNPTALLLARPSNDKRNVDHWPGQKGAAMLIDTALKALPMIGRHDDGCVAQLSAVFQFRHKGAEGAVCGYDEFVVEKAGPVHLSLLVGFVMQSIGVLFEGLLLVIRDETSAVLDIGKIGGVRRHYVHPQEKSVGQFGENPLRLFETLDRPASEVEIAGHPAEKIPHIFEIAVFFDAGPDP